VDGVAGLDVAALGVHEDGDVALRLGGERHQLAHDIGRELLGDLAADDDGAGAEQALRHGVEGAVGGDGVLVLIHAMPRAYGCGRRVIPPVD
jgi:hypothetical protein